MMRALPRMTAVAILLMTGVSGVGLSSQAHSNTASAATRANAACGARVAVLGADMSAGGRFEVQRALKVGSHTVQVNETYQDELAQAGGLIPAPLLGSAKEAVSSALLGPLPAGSGLTVDVNANIQLDAPRTYANALLTAGVTDAEVGVAAPTSQPALGTTALLGLLRAAQLSCLTITPARRTLAIREAALSDKLALAQGRTRYSAVPALINTLKGTAVSRRLTTPAALAALVKGAAAAKGLTLSATQRQGLVAYLGALVASGTYTDIAARDPHFTSTASGALRVTLSGASTTPATRVPATVTAGPGGAAVHSGTVASVNVAAGLLTVQEANGAHSYHASSPDLSVTRNGETSSLGALKTGDKITLTTVHGVVTAIDARSSSSPATGAGNGTATAATPAATASAPATNAVKGWGTAWIAVLAALLILLLLLLPLIIGLLRRRRERDAVRTTTTAPMAATQGEDTELLDTESDVRKATYVPRRVVRRAGGKNRRR